MVFAGQYLDYVTYRHLVTLMLVGDDAVAVDDDQKLVGGVAVPTGSSTLAKVDDAAAESLAVTVAK